MVEEDGNNCYNYYIFNFLCLIMTKKGGWRKNEKAYDRSTWHLMSREKRQYLNRYKMYIYYRNKLGRTRNEAEKRKIKKSMERQKYVMDAIRTNFNVQYATNHGALLGIRRPRNNNNNQLAQRFPAAAAFLNP